MIVNYSKYWEIAGVKQHSEFYDFLNKILFDKEKREKFYLEILKINSDVSKDTFRDYFEAYGAERKTNQQDYTPDSISKILSVITRGDNKEADYSGYDMTAGTGSLIIKKWWDDMTEETPFTYAPHRYLYLVEEISDNVIPFLIHNLALRGMNCIVIHGDVLERTAKNIYFVQNSKDDYLQFSDINIFPRNETIAKEFKIKEWIGEGIKHIESEKVLMNFAFPSIKKQLEINENYIVNGYKPPEKMTLLEDVAELEIAKKKRFIQQELFSLK